MVKSWILPLKCNGKLQTAIKGDTLLLKVTVSASPRVAYEHGHIQLPLRGAWAASGAGGYWLWPLLIFIMSTGNADFLVQGQFPKWQLGKAALLESWDKRAGILIYPAWQVLAKNRNETAEFPGESPSQPAALWMSLIHKALNFFFFLLLCW